MEAWGELKIKRRMKEKLDCLFRLFWILNLKVNKIMATMQELANELRSVKELLVKIGSETSALLEKIAALEEAIAAGGNTTPEVDEALAALRTQAQVVDDLVPDA